MDFAVKLRFLGLIAAGLAITSCASTPPFTPGPHLTLAQETELPPPAWAEGGGIPAYRIGALDKLSINVFGMPELSQEEVQADASGHIALPLAGTVEALGKTPHEVARAIEGALRGYVRDPKVAVNLVETLSHVITVDGEVRQPGLYPALGKMTLMRAVASAQGTTEFAKLHDVVIFRTVGDRNMAALYNLEAIRRGTYPDPQVYAHDVVVVGDSPQRRRLRDLVQATGYILTPVVAVLQNF